MSKEADENYFEEFFSFLNEIMDGKRSYDDLFKTYKLNEVIDIIIHSTSTTFLTLARMDVEMDFVSNLLHLIWFIRTGDNEYKNLDAGINMYNKMTNLFIRELYRNVKEISNMGLDEDQIKTFKEFLKDMNEIINKRDDFREDTTSK